MAELVEKFEVPIPIRALKTANVYLIRESGEFSLIDTGMNLESYQYISNGLNNRAPARIILTHLHIDHIGGAMGLKKEFGSEVIMGEEDWRRVQAIQEDPEGFLRWMTEFLLEEGVPRTVLDKIVMGHSVLDHLKDYAELSVDRTIKTEMERIGSITDRARHHVHRRSCDRPDHAEYQFLRRHLRFTGPLPVEPSKNNEASRHSGISGAWTRSKISGIPLQ
ncbi:MBL fold metallo-hydrolase [Thermoplasmatales archaeon AK]|nr:MBL fold metallo-hydrolase [Thermoplasmatales archaeon AK]